MRIVPLFFLSFLLLVQCSKPFNVNSHQKPLTEDYNDKLKPFYHGVASGDPYDDSVVIWTKVTPVQAGEIEVKWEISTDANMNSIVNSGIMKTNSLDDYTTRVEVGGLLADTRYFYRFSSNGHYSVIGRTKTLPTGTVDSLSIGVVSCSNYEWGYFNSYRKLAEKEVDFVLHLGDYIYEYGPGTYGDTTIGRKVRPPYEILKLGDYRERYSQYRLDPDLNEIHRRHPFICIWDDHEVTNDSYTTGAQNHQEGEGDYSERKRAAKKAYYEWIPIRGESSDKHYRSFNIGSLAQLIMLDERLEGRTKPAESFNSINNESRMLGETQLQWLYQQMESSSSQWNIIGNSVIFSDLNLTGLRESKVNLDAWDGFPYEKNEILNFLNSNPAERTIFLTGDTHSSWAFQSPRSASQNGQNPVKQLLAMEFGTPSVNSGNSDERNSKEEVIAAQDKILAQNSHLKYVNLSDHGYMILTLYRDGGKADWYYVDNLRSRQANESLAKSVRFTVSEGSLNLISTE